GPISCRSENRSTKDQLALSACLAAAFFAVRGGPISAGWNSAAAASVQASDSASSLPMLEMPGCAENHRLPNAVAVISALKNTARVRLDCRKLYSPRRHAIT